MPLAKTTELNAINTMLTAVGQQPVSSLSATSADVQLAKTILNEVIRDVLSQGWRFNTEYDVELTPDGVTNKITVASNVLSVDKEDSEADDIVLRGETVYDRANRTDQFTSSIKVRIVYILDFEECSQEARHYMGIRAARIFQDRMKGSEKHHAFTEKDEYRALTRLRSRDGQQADHNLRYTPSIYKIVGNRRSVSSRMRRR